MLVHEDTCSWMYTSCRASARRSSPGPCRSWRLFKRLCAFVCVFSVCVGLCRCGVYDLYLLSLAVNTPHTRTAPQDSSSITAGGQVRDGKTVRTAMQHGKTEHRLKRLNARYSRCDCTVCVLRTHTVQSRLYCMCPEDTYSTVSSGHIQ